MLFRSNELKAQCANNSDKIENIKKSHKIYKVKLIETDIEKLLNQKVKLSKDVELLKIAIKNQKESSKAYNDKIASLKSIIETLTENKIKLVKAISIISDEEKLAEKYLIELSKLINEMNESIEKYHTEFNEVKNNKKGSQIRRKTLIEIDQILNTKKHQLLNYSDKVMKYKYIFDEFKREIEPIKSSLVNFAHSYKKL